jgi:hypothetical protein
MNKNINEVFNTLDLRRKIFNYKTKFYLNNYYIKNNKVINNELINEFKQTCLNDYEHTKYSFMLFRLFIKKINKWSEKKIRFQGRKRRIINMKYKYFMPEQNHKAKHQAYWQWRLFTGYLELDETDDDDDDDYHFIEIVEN